MFGWHIKQKYFISSMWVQSLLSQKSWNSAGSATQTLLLSDTSSVPHPAPGISICLLLSVKRKRWSVGEHFCGPSNCWSISNHKEEESKLNIFPSFPARAQLIYFVTWTSKYLSVKRMEICIISVFEVLSEMQKNSYVFQLFSNELLTKRYPWRCPLEATALKLVLSNAC